MESPTDVLSKTFAASLLALALTLGLIFFATGGGRAFTTEALRRDEVARKPQLIPDFAVIDIVGRTTTLKQLLATDKKVWIVDFVYTRCQTICSSLGSVYQQLQRQIQTRAVQNRVGLLSISFDPGHDDVPALKEYGKRMHMDPIVWKIVTLASVADRRRLLDAFGIMVVPAPLGEFEHNAALHILGPDAQLLRIIDYADSSKALDTALGLTQ